MEWVPVTRSSAFAAVAYDSKTRTLGVRFKSGTTHPYMHHGVPETIYRAFMAAGSMGTYYRDFIKGRY